MQSAKTGKIILTVLPLLLLQTFTSNLQAKGLTAAKIKPALIMDNTGGFFVTWQNSADNQIYGRKYKFSGEPAAPEFKLAPEAGAQQSNPATAVNSRGEAVFTFQSVSKSKPAYSINVVKIKSRTVIKQRIATNTGISQNPSAAIDDKGNIMIAWQGFNSASSSFDIFVQKIAADGKIIGRPFIANAYSAGRQSNPKIIYDNRRFFIITWESENPKDKKADIYAREFDFSVADNKQPAEQLVNTYQKAEQLNPDIAADKQGNYLITWQSYAQDGSDYGIYGQLFNNSGKRQGTEFQVNTNISGRQINPKAAILSNGDFIISWQGFGQNTQDYDIYSQRFSKNGIKQFLETRVNDFIEGNQENPAIAVNAKDNYVIGWQSDNALLYTRQFSQ